MAVWKRKEAARRQQEEQMLERLEWFDRPELPRRRRVVVVPSSEPRAPEPARAAAVEEAPPSSRPTTTLPLPPWDARSEPAPPPPEAVEAPEETPAEPSRWLVAPPRPVEPIAPQAKGVGETAPTAVPHPPPTMRVYRGKLRPALLGLIALVVSGAFIFAASRLDSQETSTSAPKAPATPAAAKPTPPPAPPKPQAQPKPKPAAKPTPKPKPTPKAKPKPKPKPTARPKAKPKPTGTPTPKRKPAPTRTLPPFAWSPVAGASAYEFQLFLGSKLVYTHRTATTGLTVPATWTKNGKLFEIVPGHYRWYVWAIVGGERSTKAIVQATLDVPK